MKQQTVSFPFFKFSGWFVLVGFFLIECTDLCSAQNIGINTTGVAANASAGLDVDFTNKGALIPRVSLTSNTDVITIASPANYLTVYNTNAAMTNGNGTGMYYWSGSAWIYMIAASNGPGTSGQVVTSQGGGINPQWVTPSVSGGGGGCEGADWTLVAVATSGTKTNFGTFAASYTVAANKEVLIVIEGYFNDFTPAITDLISVDQIDYVNSFKYWDGSTLQNTGPLFWIPSLVYTSPRMVPSILPVTGTADYVIVHGKKNKATSLTQIGLTPATAATDGMAAQIMMDGTGAIFLQENTVSKTFALYIFER
jgi:hypothetical protein